MSLLTKESSRRDAVDRIHNAAIAFAAFTQTVATYPRESRKEYVVLGACNEAGELVDALDQNREGAFDMAKYAKAFDELGDVVWYLARVPVEFALSASFGEMCLAAAMEIKDHPRESPVTCVELQLGLMKYTGLMAGVVKKMLRDGDVWNETKRKQKLEELERNLYEALKLVIEHTERTSPLLGIEGGFAHLLRLNTDKLQDRKERGVLKGDGDAR